MPIPFSTTFGTLPAGIAITYLFTGLLAKFRSQSTKTEKVLITSYFVACGIFVLLSVSNYLGVIPARTDVDSSKILAFEGIGTALLCGGWLSRHEKKPIPWIMLGIGSFFLISGGILSIPNMLVFVLLMIVMMLPVSLIIAVVTLRKLFS